MRKHKWGTGNCPVCKLGVIVRKNGITPRHGHIKWKNGWLPPCSGSGQKAIWIVWPEDTENEAVEDS